MDLSIPFLLIHRGVLLVHALPDVASEKQLEKVVSLVKYFGDVAGTISKNPFERCLLVSMDFCTYPFYSLKISDMICKKGLNLS